MHDALRRFKENGSYNRRQGYKKRCTTERKGRFMLLCVLRDRRTTSNIVAQRLRNSHGTTVSARPVGRRLRENNLLSRKPAMGLKLAQHRQQR